jgi:glycine hydroxymethyltransferase
MGVDEMREIGAIIAGVLRATVPATTTAGKRSLVNYTLEDATRVEAESRVRDLLTRFPLYPEIDL